MSNPKLLFLISGPSGVGKNAIIEGVKKIIPEVEETISCTTRKPRSGEKDKTHYYFLSEDEFDKKIKRSEFLEYFKVHGMYYGTLKSEVARIAENNKIPIIIIDVRGALHIKKHRPSSVLIFIRPDSWKTTERRLRARNISKSELELRLKNASKELLYAKFYDYQVVNYTGEINKAIQKIVKIIKEKTTIDNNK